MSSSDQTSLQLRDAMAGDLGALDRLVAHLSPLLVAQASYRMGPVLRRHHDAEDIVHDAWLVTLPRLGELRPHKGRHTPALLRFLSTTILHRVRNLARKHFREQPAEPQDHVKSPSSIPIEQTGVVSKAVRGETVNQVIGKLDGLEDIDRTIVLLRGAEQQTNQTVGVLLQLEPKTVSKRYHRALEKLRASLPGSVFDELEAEAEETPDIPSDES